MTGIPTFAVVGHPNKGKSSIVSTLAQDDSVRIAPEPGTTTECRAYPMRIDDEVQYVLIDTPGFQRARRALEWMRGHETHAGAHRAVVESFVAEHRGTDRFPDECALLAPILDGAGILYVADGSLPYGPEFEAEMEILRWTGQPSLALINPISGTDHVEEWRAALQQYFKIVRVFDAHFASFEARLGLLRGFGQLNEAWREPLEAAVAALAEERDRVHARTARTLAGLLCDVLVHVSMRRLAPDADPALYQTSLEQTWKDELRERERRARRDVERIYGHRSIERVERGIELLEQDLFSTDHWFFWGLDRRQLIASGAAGGAVLGGAIDAGVGGASLLLGSLVGAALGGAGAWWTSTRLARMRVLQLPMGGRLLRCGPASSANFPYVVLGRALYHHARVAGRAHADRSELVLGDDPDRANWIERMDPGRRRELDRIFRDIRAGEERTADLAECLLPVVAEGDAPGAARTSGSRPAPR
jgi:Domain of unknown function (DUF3482)/50S ribosome-binding GTPase